MIPDKIRKDLEKLYITDKFGNKYLSSKEIPTGQLVDWFKEKFKIRTDVHRMCLSCQISHLVKYMETPGVSIKSFEPKCDFVIPGLPTSMRQAVSDIADKRGLDFEKATKFVLASFDPVSWAEMMFGFDEKERTDGRPKRVLRSYQKEIIRCTAKRIVFRAGRRAGKTFSLAIKLLFMAFNHKIFKGTNLEGKDIEKGPRIVIITPFTSQLSNLFEEMEGLLKENPDLCEGIEITNRQSLFTKTPHYVMSFKNGATIRGYVSGVSNKEDGSAGATIRGLTADILYLDEMDLIPDSILDKVIRPLLITHPDVYLFVSSTPIGKRATFYKWSEQRPDFKTFYVPSTALPHWNQLEKEILGDSTKEALETEYFAKFIDSQFGVFKPSLVHAARADWEYKDVGGDTFYKERGIKNRAILVKCLGIDWNKNAGSEFVVTIFDPLQNKFFVVEATNISSSQFSAEGWKEEVRRLNYKWKPDYIYADEGYGHTVIEDLRLEAHRLAGKKQINSFEQQTIHLTERLKSFNFSSSVELRDPITGHMLKKHGKLFLVETLVRVFEAEQIKFPEEDQVLIKQLLNYIVLKMSDSTGKPVYGPENSTVADHRLDALMLAVGGIYLERSVYSKGNIAHGTPELLLERKLENAVILDDKERKLDIAKQFSILKLLRTKDQEEQLDKKKTLPHKPVLTPKRKGETILPPAVYERDEEGLYLKQKRGDGIRRRK